MFVLHKCYELFFDVLKEIKTLKCLEIQHPFYKCF
uniref:Uncharacterized protein n=1 Tax=Anguilla anguilla TaxID=7936 RepID=A0A0E9UHN6_ANGAN